MCARYGSTVEEELEFSQENLALWEKAKVESHEEDGWNTDGSEDGYYDRGIEAAKERLAEAEAGVAKKYEEQRAKVKAARERAAKARKDRKTAAAV